MAVSEEEVGLAIEAAIVISWGLWHGILCSYQLMWGLVACKNGMPRTIA